MEDCLVRDSLEGWLAMTAKNLKMNLSCCLSFPKNLKCCGLLQEVSKASSCLEARDDITLEGDTHSGRLKWKKSLMEEKMSKKAISGECNICCQFCRQPNTANVCKAICITDFKDCASLLCYNRNLPAPTPPY